MAGNKHSNGGVFFYSNLIFGSLSLLLFSLLLLNYDPLAGLVALDVLVTTCYLDGVSLSLLLLNVLIYLVSVLFTGGSVRFGARFHLHLLLSIYILLVLSFGTSNLLLFYIFLGSVDSHVPAHRTLGFEGA